MMDPNEWTEQFEDRAPRKKKTVDKPVDKPWADERELLERRKERGPALSLLEFCMDDAVNILRRYPRRSNSVLETIRWVEGTCRSEPLFSFREICELLDLNVDATRERLLAIANGPRQL